MYQVEFSKTALKDLKKLSPDIRKLIISKIEYFIASPNPLNFASHLINYDIGQYRFRVGDYRIIFEIESETIFILTIGHRREIYR